MIRWSLSLIMSISGHLQKLLRGRGTSLLYHLVKQRPGVLEEVVWTVKLLHLTSVHHLEKIAQVTLLSLQS